MTDERPALSVVVLVDRQRARGAKALASVLEQDLIQQIEILLLDLASRDAPSLPGADHPSVRVIPHPRGGSFGCARAEGVRLARAPIVAFVEEHCVVFPGWARALVSAFQGPYVGVGGEVHNGSPGQGISDAVALMTYPQWLPPARRSESMLLAGNNSAYRRDVLLAYGRRLPALLGTELLLQWQLHRDGHRVLVDPAVKFAHTNETALRENCAVTFYWNRVCAPRRARLFRWSPVRAAVYVWLAPLIPWIRLGKLFIYFAGERPRYLRDVVRYAPVILGVQAAAVAGQTVGLLAGAGDAEVRFIEYELNANRTPTDRPLEPPN